MSTLINLIEEPTPETPVEILQLYDELELLRLDDPPRHTLFILGREPIPTEPDRLLLVDPPPDLQSRFRVEGDVAYVATYEPGADVTGADGHRLAAPRLETQPGGTAHIRLGRHYVDIYTQQFYAAIFFPALGILYSGVFGSDTDLPRLAEGDDGSGALETVRLMAALVKSRPVKLLIPHVGELAQETVPIMERLAADVAYLHNLSRIGPAVDDEADEARLESLAATLLPAERRSETAQAMNLANLRTLRKAHPG